MIKSNNVYQQQLLEDLHNNYGSSLLIIYFQDIQNDLGTIIDADITHVNTIPD
jgi:hypothetical protein